VYCSKCGSQIAGAASFCPGCGQAVSVLAPVTATPGTGALAPSWPVPVVSAPAMPAGYAGVGYAGFWLRFVAHLIDGVISGLAFLVLLIPLAVLTGVGGALSKISSGEDIGDDAAAFLGLGFLFGFIGIILVVSWLYSALSESSSWQATPGKKLLNLQVTDMNGQRLSFGRASGRFFAKMISGMIPLGIGYIMAGFTEKKQALHDLIAGCLVLRKL
jgi:uncharacterized RDD family membrane protein YckC